jgi:hypothetical protein
VRLDGVVLVRGSRRGALGTELLDRWASQLMLTKYALLLTLADVLRRATPHDLDLGSSTKVGVIVIFLLVRVEATLRVTLAVCVGGLWC